MYVVLHLVNAVMIASGIGAAAVYYGRCVSLSHARYFHMVAGSYRAYEWRSIQTISIVGMAISSTILLITPLFKTWGLTALTMTSVLVVVASCKLFLVKKGLTWKRPSGDAATLHGLGILGVVVILDVMYGGQPKGTQISSWVLGCTNLAIIVEMALQDIVKSRVLITRLRIAQLLTRLVGIVLLFIFHPLVRALLEREGLPVAEWALAHSVIIIQLLSVPGLCFGIWVFKTTNKENHL